MSNFFIGDEVQAYRGTGPDASVTVGKVDRVNGEWLGVDGEAQPFHYTAVELVRPVKQDGNPRKLSDPVIDDFMTLSFGGVERKVYRGSYATTPTGESDPSGISLNTPGAKADAGKLRPTLVLRDMARAVEAVVKIATEGAEKYTAGGWLKVPQGQERYEDADLRHMLARFKGQPVDQHSKSLHLAHEAWNALAKLELYLREQETKGTA